MQRLRIALAVLLLLVFGVPGQPSSFEPAAPRAARIRWATKTIRIALSDSLYASPVAVLEGSDIEGAVRRALDSWSNAAGVKFVVVPSKLESISAVNAPDGVSLITIAATPENLSIFRDETNTARTRVFFDSETGEISEADIVLNPFPFSEDGLLLQFSTNGTPGTYDLESTLTHEIGHLLGLNHSHVAGATMQPSQGINGTYGMPALTERSLSDADNVAARGLYGPCEGLGSVKGRILNSSQLGVFGLGAAHVWLEDITSGRVTGSVTTGTDGRFNIDCLPAGDYRAMVGYSADSFSARESKRAARQSSFRSVEISGSVRVTAEKPVVINYIFVPPQNSRRSLDPRMFGTGGDLSTAPIPARAGSKLTIYVSGLGVDQVPGSNFTLGSPFIIVNPSSLTLEQANGASPIVSFEITLAPNAPTGDYTIRLQANSGETAYLVGALTVEKAGVE